MGTPAIFIGGGEVEKVTLHPYEIPPWQGGSAAEAAGGLSLYREKVSTGTETSPRPPSKGELDTFSPSVVSLKGS